MSRLPESLEQRLMAFAQLLVNQQDARPVVLPNRNALGYWFGGGNLIEDTQGRLWLVGRYRDHGDSRTGLGAGPRGLELAIFRSADRGLSFHKVLSFSKPDLNVGEREVLSIEGSALHRTPEAVELFVSSEKSGIGYPPGLERYLKPNTGVWTIDRLVAEEIEGLADANVETVLQSGDPQFLHVKDPVIYQPAGSPLVLLFCSHPYCWTSSNSGFVMRSVEDGSWRDTCFDFFPRGFTWDVAMTRTTAVLDVPRVGAFVERQVSLLFYDGGECVRNHQQHHDSVPRPRGYSCEELGGAAYFTEGQFRRPQRLSLLQPLFVSPWGTGCSRYVDVLTTHDGYYVTWQQSQESLAQSLVLNFVSHQEAREILQ